jgi:hypothetical protein
MRPLSKLLLEPHARTTILTFPVIQKYDASLFERTAHRFNICRRAC